MEPFDHFADRLDAIRQAVEQAGPTGTLDPSMVQNLHATLAEMKDAMNRSMEDLKNDSLAKAKEMKAQAAKMLQEQDAEVARARGEVPAAPMPRPWEDHQGLADDLVHRTIAGLIEAAFPPTPPGPRR